MRVCQPVEACRGLCPLRQLLLTSALTCNPTVLTSVNNTIILRTLSINETSDDGCARRDTSELLTSDRKELSADASICFLEGSA